jgi:hypothetical protein
MFQIQKVVKNSLLLINKGNHQKLLGCITLRAMTDLIEKAIRKPIARGKRLMKSMAR